MSTNLRANEFGREIAFGLGAFVGMLLFALGIATLILALSVGFRRGQMYLTPTTAIVLLVGGLVLLVGGIIARLYRHRLTQAHEDRVKTGSVVAILVGIAMLLYRFSPQATVSAPFLASPREKLLLFLIAYALIAIGLIILRGAAKIVGW